MKKKRTVLLLQEISKIKDPIEFLGLARLLKVRLQEEGQDAPKSFTTLLDELLRNFEKSNRDTQKFILNLLKSSNEKGGALDGNTTETAAETPIVN